MAAHQAPPSLGFSRQEHWSGLPFPSPVHESESEVAQSCPTLATPWTAAYQAPPSMGFSRQECWSGVPLPSSTLDSTDQLFSHFSSATSPSATTLLLPSGVPLPPFILLNVSILPSPVLGLLLLSLTDLTSVHYHSKVSGNGCSSTICCCCSLFSL